jgi:hypothetical protein
MVRGTVVYVRTYPGTCYTCAVRTYYHGTYHVYVHVYCYVPYVVHTWFSVHMCALFQSESCDIIISRVLFLGFVKLEV